MIEIPDDIQVLGELEMLPLEESGWEHPMYTNARPSHKFDDSNLRFEGRVILLDREKISYGEKSKVKIYFMDVPEIKEFLYVGNTWEICAGPIRVIGKCKIEKIL